MCDSCLEGTCYTCVWQQTRLHWQTDWQTEASSTDKPCKVCNIFKVQSVPTNRLTQPVPPPPRFATPQVMTRQCPSDLHRTHSTHTHWMSIYTQSYGVSHIKAAGRRFLWFKLSWSWNTPSHLTSLGYPHLILCTFITFTYNPILDESARNLDVIQWKCDNSSDMLCLHMTLTDM